MALFNFQFTGAVFDEITANDFIAHQDELDNLESVYSDIVGYIMSSTESSEDIALLFKINAISEKLYLMCDRISTEISDHKTTKLSEQLDALGVKFWNAYNISDWMLRAWKTDGHWDASYGFEEKLGGILANLSKQED